MTTEDETHTQAQVRLLLERRCSTAFRAIYKGRVTRYQFTLIAFDFGNQAYDNVAFKTSLSVSALVDAFSGLVEGWASRTPRFAPEGVDSPMLRQLADEAKTALPGLGFVMLVGDAFESAYVSNGERTDVAKMIRNDLLPEWGARV